VTSPPAAVGTGRVSQPREICHEKWVAAEQAEATAIGLRFAILPGTSFEERGKTYTFAVLLPQDSDASEITLLAFAGAPGETPRRIHSEKIPTEAPGQLDTTEAPTDCFAPDMGIDFSLTVADLDSDGTHEVILENNAEGSCPSCLGEVSVYKVSESGLKTVVEESTNGVEFSDGKGLVVEGYVRGRDGRPAHPTRKTFFMPANR